MSSEDAPHDAPDIAAHRPQIRAIVAAIREEEGRLRAAHPWLARQDAIGALCFLGSLAAMAAVAALHLRGALSPWLAAPLMALPLSVLHELEHDLIHGLYFRRSPRAQDLLFLVIWLCKLSIDPWIRRDLHLRHHRRSGQIDDIEERLIGLGVPFGLERIALCLPIGGLLCAPGILRDVRKARREERARHPAEPPARRGPRKGPSPVLIALDAVVILVLPAVAAGGAMAGWTWAAAVLVLLVAPNVLRHFCLALMSSYSHYYGDIAPNDVFVQNQILSHWALYPLQLFCFGFGSTHVLHHYVVDQPFYLRQMVAPAAHREMARLGVRVNDAGVVARANRRG